MRGYTRCCTETWRVLKTCQVWQAAVVGIEAQTAAKAYQQHEQPAVGEPDTKAALHTNSSTRK